MKYFIPLIVLFIVACKNDSTPKIESFKNKSNYKVEIGDTIKIYHSTNSCCQYCLPNADKLNHLKYTGIKSVSPEKKGCMGRDNTSASIFIAKSIGIDTIRDAIIAPMEKCDDRIKGLSNYIVKIK